MIKWLYIYDHAYIFFKLGSEGFTSSLEVETTLSLPFYICSNLLDNLIDLIYDNTANTVMISKSGDNTNVAIL
jgi:hypothetical protein